MSYADEVRPPLSAPLEPDARYEFQRDVERPRILAEASEAMRSYAVAILRMHAHDQRRGIAPGIELEPDDARTPGITLEPEPCSTIGDYLNALGYTAK